MAWAILSCPSAETDFSGLYANLFAPRDTFVYNEESLRFWGTRLHMLGKIEKRSYSYKSTGESCFIVHDVVVSDFWWFYTACSECLPGTMAEWYGSWFVRNTSRSLLQICVACTTIYNRSVLYQMRKIVCDAHHWINCDIRDNILQDRQTDRISIGFLLNIQYMHYCRNFWLRTRSHQQERFGGLFFGLAFVVFELHIIHR